MKHKPIYQRIREYTELGCSLAKLGRAKLPLGYAILLNADQTHYFWINEKGDESAICWNKWAVFHGAHAHFHKELSREAAAICDRYRRG